jgi:acyl dehydratase
MRVFDTIDDLKGAVGEELGVSDWFTIDQDRINQFADATEDHQWIHVDVERAKRELPTKNTIAHGFLTLSLIAGLREQVYDVKHKSRGINYGLNKVRFTNMVPAGARVRLRQKLKSAEDIPGPGVRLTTESVIEIEGEDKPACIAETVGLTFA